MMFDAIIKELQLGEPTARPERVSGGYLHKMYRLETTTGRYAVKLLNPVIMKRPDALQNYQRAEELERVLLRHKIPVVPAIEINGSKMQCIQGQYFYVFQWVEGKALGYGEIESRHCKLAGELLARIHKAEPSDKPLTAEKICVDWDNYIRIARESCNEIADEMQRGRRLLYQAQEEYNRSLERAPQVTCICDGDMDSKNVLWVNGEPRIIDLECLDYGNPFLEMFQLALSWSGGVVCHMDYECLFAFLDAYQKEYGDFQVNWQDLYGIGFSWLSWLAYNVRRALGIECGDEEEKKLGIEQVHETIPRILYYASIKEELLNCLASLY